MSPVRSVPWLMVLAALGTTGRLGSRWGLLSAPRTTTASRALKPQAPILREPQVTPYSVEAMQRENRERQKNMPRPQG